MLHSFFFYFLFLLLGVGGAHDDLKPWEDELLQ